MLALLASHLLGQIYSVNAEIEPVEVLMQLDELMRIGLHQKSDGSTGNDGCDAAIVQIAPSTNTITYSGCGIDLYRVGQSNMVERHASSNISLGYPSIPTKTPQQIVLNIEPNQILMMASDGIFDQIGTSLTGRKLSFGSTRFINSLEQTSPKNCLGLVNGVVQEMNQWRGSERVRDDLMVLAFTPLFSKSS
jgi:hypothetical protein